MFDREMREALEADAQKLRDLTGEDHQVFFCGDPYVCGEHFCEDCGDCMACYGDSECFGPHGVHWVARGEG